jgi:hypothetical protein
MTNTPPSIQRTFTTEAELQTLVADALTTGVLDISHCIIEVEFNLPDLLKKCGQPDKLIAISILGIQPRETVECPFEIKACNTKFNDKLVFYAVTFSSGVDFHSATFSGNKTTFLFVIFLCNVSFVNAEFLGELDFGSATFLDKVNFHSATFSGGATFFCSATFLGNVHFIYTTFLKYVSFNSAVFFREANWGNAVFMEDANFHSTTFLGEATLGLAKFKGNTRFTALKLSSITYFHIDKTIIEAPLYLSVKEDLLCLIFSNAPFLLAYIFLNKNFSTVKQWIVCLWLFSKPTVQIIEPIMTEQGCIVVDYDKHTEEQHWRLNIPNMECDGDAVRLKIRNLSAESNAKILFEDCHFYGKNVAFTNVAMHNVAITGGNTVKGMLFDHCDFDTTNPSEWQLKYLHFRSLAGEDQWLNSTDPEKLKERALVYASLKTTATQGGETQLANDFHFWQQYYQGKCKSSPWNTMYKYSSAYGLDVILPVFWFIRVLVTFACVYALLLNPIAPITLFYIGFGSLLPILIEDNINPSLRKKVYFIRICLFLIGLVLLVGLYKVLLQGLPLSVSSSLPFIFADNDTIKELLPSIPTEFGITWASGKVLLFYLLYIFQHLLQGFLLFQIGAAIRNKVKR